MYVYAIHHVHCPLHRHTPHVMTLFDRKVDLARFTTTTPLYTMCRDWMSNDPNNLHFYNDSTHGHTPTGGGKAMLITVNSVMYVYILCSRKLW